MFWKRWSVTFQKPSTAHDLLLKYFSFQITLYRQVPGFIDILYGKK